MYTVKLVTAAVLISKKTLQYYENSSKTSGSMYPPTSAYLCEREFLKKSYTSGICVENRQFRASGSALRAHAGSAAFLTAVRVVC